MKEQITLEELNSRFDMGEIALNVYQYVVAHRETGVIKTAHNRKDEIYKRLEPRIWEDYQILTPREYKKKYKP